MTLGLAMMGWAPGVPGQYAGVFFTCAGANSNIPHMMSWQANNIRGQWKRAFCSATLVAFGGIGGIAGSLVFRGQDKATGYKPGLWACITGNLIILAIISVTDVYFYFCNKKQARGELIIEPVPGTDFEDKFRYTY